MQRLQLQSLAAEALKMKYGFAPSLHNVKIIESNATGTSITADVNGHLYVIQSHLTKQGEVYTGRGIVRKIRSPTKK